MDEKATELESNIDETAARRIRALVRRTWTYRWLAEEGGLFIQIGKERLVTAVHVADFGKSVGTENLALPIGKDPSTSHAFSDLT